MTRSSKNPDAARQLLEFLTSATSQESYTAANHEYPLRGQGDDPVLQNWGPFTQATVSAERLGELNGKAAELMAENGWQ